MPTLKDLFTEQGQSPWLDNLKRGWITDGELARQVEAGIRGITSNPTIFQKAMEAGDDYDQQLGDLVAGGQTIEASYWDLVASDIEAALAILRPTYDDSDGRDGFVSVELAPELARDTARSEAQARSLHLAIDEPNLLVKIPGTVEGLPAIQAMIAEGRSINITLIFSLERYRAVIEAYLAGLESCPGDLSRIASVASFFVSRVDTEVDRRLAESGSGEAPGLAGQAAVAQAQVAYEIFAEQFSGPRWEALVARGARVQRPLWASTSTKDEAYSDVLYVDSLIGPDTVNTMPEATIEAFVDHGVLARTLDADPAAARQTLDRLAELGIDMEDVASRLEDEGVASFSKSFDEVLDTLATKAEGLGAA